MSNRKVFLDCGGHKGVAVKRFKETKYWKEEGFEIISFEAIPKLAKKYQKEGVDRETYFNKAVWIEDGTIDFFADPQQLGQGGSVHKHKTTGNLDKENPLTVETMDFSQWILDNFDKNDQIIVKMDIEGAEYEVLNKMIEDGSINYINLMFVEWHQKKINYPIEKHKALRDAVKSKVNLVKLKRIMLNK
jgi:FkbM family methyltransferase